MISRFIARVIYSDAFFYFMVAINLAGTAYGFYWYRDQLAATPFYLWLLTSDSPLAAAYFLGALYLLRKQAEGQGAEFWKALAYFALIKYGLWTTYIIAAVYWITGNITHISGLLMLSHLGMALEAIIYLACFRFCPSPAVVLAATGFFTLNDYYDYWLGNHPYFSSALSYSSVQAFSVGMTVILFFVFLLVALAKSRGQGSSDHKALFTHRDSSTQKVDSQL